MMQEMLSGQGVEFTYQLYVKYYSLIGVGVATCYKVNLESRQNRLAATRRQTAVAILNEALQG